MSSRSSRTAARTRLEEAYEILERYAPDRATHMLRWIRSKRGSKVRIALGSALVGLGVLGPLLPVAGVWMIPLGLLLIAEDMPEIRHPVAELLFWLERKWRKLRAWWQRRLRMA